MGTLKVSLVFVRDTHPHRGSLPCGHSRTVPCKRHTQSFENQSLDATNAKLFHEMLHTKARQANEAEDIDNSGLDNSLWQKSFSQKNLRHLA